LIGPYVRDSLLDYLNGHVKLSEFYYEAIFWDLDFKLSPIEAATVGLMVLRLYEYTSECNRGEFTELMLKRELARAAGLEGLMPFSLPGL
jgi:hypothetical protein